MGHSGVVDARCCWVENSQRQERDNGGWERAGAQRDGAVTDGAASVALRWLAMMEAAV